MPRYNALSPATMSSLLLPGPVLHLQKTVILMDAPRVPFLQILLVSLCLSPSQIEIPPSYLPPWYSLSQFTKYWGWKWGEKAHGNWLFSLALWYDGMLYPWSLARRFTHTSRSFHLQTEKLRPKSWLDLPNVKSKCGNRRNSPNILSGPYTLHLVAGHCN